MTRSSRKPEAARRYRAFWQDEIDSAAIYHALAGIESQPAVAQVYHRLATVEERHASLWADKLRTTGQDVRAPQVSWRTRILIWLARRFGPQFVLPAISAAEQMDSHHYVSQMETDATQIAVEERSHARVLQAISSASADGVAGGTLALLEGRHRATGGNALRAAVLGANDGLLSNLSLVMGVAGAALSGRSILITGIAGLLAGAGSMALGEWLSVQSSRELYQRQIAIEAQEVAEIPDEEAAELTLIYQAKGIPEAQARELAARLMANTASALDTLAREELGVDPHELGGSAWEAAAMSFVLFAIGAMVPVLPFMVLRGAIAVVVSLIVSAVGLFGIGAGITLLTGRSVIFSGLRQVLFGLAAAALTYGIGRLIGVSLAG